MLRLLDTRKNHSAVSLLPSGFPHLENGESLHVEEAASQQTSKTFTRPIPPSLHHTMASKLCCMTEQDGRDNSPELPNVRPSHAAPVQQPLLLKQTSSPNSQFTSARSEDLHELQEIFHKASDSGEDRATPMQVVHGRFSRPSMHSIRSLHKMTSMRSIIKRKFSKNSPRKAAKSPSPHLDMRDNQRQCTSGTVIKQTRIESKQQLQITKEDLRKDLLSDKKPDEGGYDSDAQVLDDVARNIGKKSPNKRPSIHSVDWVTTSGR